LTTGFVQGFEPELVTNSQHDLAHELKWLNRATFVRELGTYTLGLLVNMVGVIYYMRFDAKFQFVHVIYIALITLVVYIALDHLGMCDQIVYSR